MKIYLNKYNGIILILLFLQVQAYPQQKITVDDIFTNPEFYPDKLSEFQWLNDGYSFTYLKKAPGSYYSSIYEHNTATGEEKILVPGNNLIANDSTQVSIENYQWSPDNKYILLTGILPARKLKTGGNFYVYDMSEEKIIYSVQSDEEQENIRFSPDSKKIGFVRDNNLFVFDLNSGEEKQLTFDGSDEILNGAFDWVYQEEFSIINGWTWSPDSKTIAFWRLDQSVVPVYKIPKYDSLYPGFRITHYPTAGMHNSLVKIGVVNVNSGKINWMDIGNNTDIYIPRVKFTREPGILSIQRLNRLQNKIDLLFCNIKTGQSKVILTDTDTAWVSVFDDLYFLKDRDRFIWPSERDGYKQFYLYDYKGDLINQITKGNWEVNRLLSVDENKNRLYYSSDERSPIFLDFCSIDLNGKNRKFITEKPGYHQVNISPNNNFFTDEFSTANSLPATNLYKINGEKIDNLITPEMSFFKDYDFSPLQFLTFKTTDGIRLNAFIIKPNNFDSTKKYPVLVFNYSGPGSQSVVDKWLGIDYIWHELLVQKGYIIFCLDNRGTGGRGKSFKDIIYKHLGKWEVHDQIEGAKYLASLPYIDKNRIGIWGWSYGGYMSALTILKGADYFKAAISVAPVIHWKFYDTIYTERYMQTPELNPEGYEESSPLSYADKLKGNLLIVHGMADDNVHFQNTVTMVLKLQEYDKQFETMFYPGKLHGIYGGITRIHLFSLMTNFILNNL
ncbi:MAG: S9 family peptidase [Ignavibacteriaceae bacterium]